MTVSPQTIRHLKEINSKLLLEAGMTQLLDTDRIAVEGVVYGLVVFRAEWSDALMRPSYSLVPITADMMDSSGASADEAAKAGDVR